MADIEQHFATIHDEIDHLKSALQATSDEGERYQLHVRLNECIRESIRLLDRWLESHHPRRPAEPPAGVDAPPLERHAGELLYE